MPPYSTADFLDAIRPSHLLSEKLELATEELDIMNQARQHWVAARRPCHAGRGARNGAAASRIYDAISTS